MNITALVRKLGFLDKKEVEYIYSIYGVEVMENISKEEFEGELYAECNTYCDYNGGNELKMFNKDMKRLLKGKTVVYGNEYYIEKRKQYEN